MRHISEALPEAVGQVRSAMRREGGEVKMVADERDPLILVQLLRGRASTFAVFFERGPDAWARDLTVKVKRQALIDEVEFTVEVLDSLARLMERISAYALSVDQWRELGDQAETKLDQELDLAANELAFVKDLMQRWLSGELEAVSRGGVGRGAVQL